MITIKIIIPLINFIKYRYINIILINNIFNLFLAILLYIEILYGNISISINITNWFNILYINSNYSFTLDILSKNMSLLILFISLLIQIYSLSYMNYDTHKNIFISTLNLFTFAMLLIVNSSNLLILLLGYELVGIVSYLLISFYFTNINANLSALSALFINKIGDLGLIISIVLIYHIFGNSEYEILYVFSYIKNQQLLIVLLLFLIIASKAKSALFGLHIWLSKAKAGPTPVSALQHSSTMITVGVFMLLKLSPLFEHLNNVLLFILLIGSLGSLFGSQAGLIENDIKGIIAYSTMSQLGYMIIAIGLSQYYISIKHLIMHAFFKSLLFLCAGAIIHAINDQQDIRKKGNIRNIMPFTYLGFILGSLSLIAFPFSAGFYSKDLLIEILRTQSINYTYIYGYIITLISAFITMLYILRILNLVFINKPNYNNKNLILQIKETPLCTIPIIILSILSIIIGYYMQNINNIAFNELFINKNNEYSTINIYNSIYTFKPILICILFIILIYMKYNINLENKNVCDQFYKLNKFNVLSNRITCAYFINSNKINKLIDRGLFNYFGVIGFNKYILYLANYQETFLLTGNLKHYILILIIILLYVIIF